MTNLEWLLKNKDKIDKSIDTCGVLLSLCCNKECKEIDACENCPTNKIVDMLDLLAAEHTEVKVDWSNVPIDTKIIVNMCNNTQLKRYFAKYEDGRVFFFSNGHTSWNQDGTCPCNPLDVRLYKEGEE